MNDPYSTLSDEVLHKYLNRVFVETGTNKGGGIATALRCGFREIHSIELDHVRYTAAGHFFRKEIEAGIVTLHNGNAGEILPSIMDKFDEPVTLWLDAHDEHGLTPLYAELATLAKHPIKTHTIMIDDLRVFGIERWGLSVNWVTVLRKLLNINPLYQLCLEPGYKADDILVCVPRSVVYI